MSYRATALQQALYNTLTGDAALMAMITGVFSHVPQGQAFPYLLIGDMDVRPMNTVDVAGADYRVSIQTFSRGKGHKQAQDILARIVAVLLPASLTISAATVVDVRLLDATVTLERDGGTYAGTVHFRITVQG